MDASTKVPKRNGRALTSLPTENPLNIFENLQYRDLKLGIAATCKQFHEILRPRDGAKTNLLIDTLLFRDDPLHDYQCYDRKNSRIHPMLLNICYQYSDGIRIYRRLENSPIRKENATSPAAQYAEFIFRDPFGDEQEKRITSGPFKSITVEDVIVAVISSLNYFMIDWIALLQWRDGLDEHLWGNYTWGGMRFKGAASGIVELEIDVEYDSWMLISAYESSEDSEPGHQSTSSGS